MPLAALPELPTLNAIQAAEPITHTDTFGNIFDAAGTWIGVITGSQADVGSKGTPTAAASIPSGQSSPKADSGGSPKSTASSAWSTLVSWAAALVTGGSTGSASGYSLEDLLFIVLGLMLMGAAFFSFKETQTVIKQTVKTVRSSADKAAAAAIAG